MNIAVQRFEPSAVLVEGILDALPDMVCQFLPDLTLTYVNSRFSSTFGRDLAGLIGSKVADLVAVENRDKFSRTITTLSRTDVEVVLDQRVLDGHGKSLWQRWTISAQFDEAGGVAGYLAVVRDNTEGKRYLDALEALMDLAAERNIKPEQSVDAVLEICRAYFDADSGVLCQGTDDACVARNIVGSGEASIGRDQCDSIGEFCTIAQRTGEVLAVANIAESNHGNSDSGGDRGFEAYIGIPVQVSNRCYGVMSFTAHAPRPDAFTAQDMDILRFAAQWLGLDIERHENWQVSERRNHELQFIFDHIPARVWYKDDTNRIVRLNRSAARFVGIEPEDAIGLHVSELSSDEIYRCHKDDLAIIESAEPRYGALEDMTSEAGTRNWALVDKIPHFDAKSGDRRLLVVANDITEARRYRNALEELMDLLNQGHYAPVETLRGILEIGCRYYNLKLGVVSRIEGDAFHEEHILAPDDAIKTQARLKQAEELFRRTAEAESPLIYCETDGGDVSPEPDGSGCGLKCFIGARIVIAGHDYGILGFACVETRGAGFGSEEINFARLAAHWVAKEIERHDTLKDLHNSEMNLRFIFDNVPTRIIFKDDTNRILRLNASAAKSMGLSVEEAEGADAYELFPEMARKYHDDDLRIFEAGQPSLGIIEKYTPKDGAVGWAQTDKFPYVDEDTGERRLLAVISDITPLKEAEEALRNANGELRRQQEYFQELYRKTPAMMHSIDQNGRIVEVSDKWLEKLGYARNEVIGRASSEFLDEESRRRAVEEMLPAFFATDRADNVNLQFMTRDGGEISIELSAIHDREGPYGHRSLAVLDDVTQRKQAQDALEQRNTELEVANENLKQFAYVAAHDLQEPLRKIQTFSDLVRNAVREGHGEDIEYGIDVLTQAAIRAREMVADLLAFSRASNHVIECHPTWFADVVTEVVENLQVQIEETGALIELDIPDIQLNADRGLLYRLMLNLLSNAMKYRRQDTVPEITVCVETGDDGTPEAIIVSDNGIGFDPKFSSVIFKPFKRLHTGDEYPGTGIGLAICATAAQRHGWSITVESEPGAGSTFRINLTDLP